MSAPGAVLIAVTHLLGVGHFARMAALGRALAGEGHRVTLVSGGRAVPTIGTSGLTLRALPPVHCRDGDFSRLLAASGAPASPDLLEERARLLEEAFREASPDTVITELYPFGRRALSREFEALLALAMAQRPRPLILASIRDVLNPPAKPGRAAQVLARLAHYDGVLVHGDETIPLDRSWPVTPDLARALHYTGYLRDGARDALAPVAEAARSGILVSAGGSDAGLALIAAAIEAAALLPGEPWRILVSEAIGPERFAAFGAAAPPHVMVERARPDFPALLARARLSVSQAGYNTVLDCAAASIRAVLVPFAAGGEREQSLRAEALAARGLARILPENRLTGESLAQNVRLALADPAPDWSGIRLDGAARAGPILRALAAGRREAEAAWVGLESRLAHMEERGEVVDIWLRDDDAVRPSPALDRFLAMLANHAIPAAFAVIPGMAEPALAERLAREAGMRVLVHGWRHANHAPAGEKAAEFGPHRPVQAMAGEIAMGLARLRALFGQQALPVFVPPWNRIDGPLAGHLAGLGFLGLSTFATGHEAGEAPGLRQMNADWDPIDWRGTRGLKPQAALIGALEARIAAELAQPAEARRAIGLLTHHLVHDGWTEDFLARAFALLAGRRAVRFLAPEAVFGLAPAGSAQL